MAEDLEHRIQMYGYSLMSGSVKQEYDNLIEHWRSYIQLLVSYAKEALQRHRKVLTDIKEEMKNRQADEELAMLAFASVGGMAASWVGGMVEHRMIPRLLGKKAKSPTSYAVDRSLRDPANVRILPIYDKKSHSQVAAKVFGDFGANLTDKHLVSPALRVPAPDQSALLSSIDRVGDSLSIDKFETNLNLALNDAKVTGGTAIENYAGTILKDREFGARWLKLAQDRQATRTTGRFNRKSDVQTIAEGLIRDAIDAQREEWASRWFFYGNNSPSHNPTFLTNAMEVEIWRIWILTEDFKRYRYKIFGDDITEQDEYRVKGSSGIDIDRILTRLVELGVVAPRDGLELKRLNQRGSAKELGIQPLEISNIEDFVDTDAERLTILNWAKNRKPQLMMGWGQGVPRRIMPIDPANIPQR